MVQTKNTLFVLIIIITDAYKTNQITTYSRKKKIMKCKRSIRLVKGTYHINTSPNTIVTSLYIYLCM